MEKEDIASLPTPVGASVALIGSKWKLLIVGELIQGTARFSELKRDIVGLSQKELSTTLKSLEEQGLIVRKVYPETPPRVEYSLTKLGMSLKPVYKELEAWGKKYLDERKIAIAPKEKMLG